MTAPSLLQRDFIDRQLEKMSEHLRDVENEEVETPVGVVLTASEISAVRQNIDDSLASPEPIEGVYYSRSPVVSAVQSALHDALEHKRTLGQVPVDDEDMGDPFTKGDIDGWVGRTALSLVGRQLRGSHPFCDAPAEIKIEPRARLVLMSDWATGRAWASNVARHAAGHIDSEDVHVVHLGDIYYTGTPRETKANFLDPWPVPRERAPTASSWALNGNHEMYSGGHGLFVTALGDTRFARQRSNGNPTSWLHFENEHWQVLGLDTAWRNRLIEVEDGRLHFFGALGHLHGKQADRIAACASDDRRLLLLSHHQLFSAYDDHAGDKSPMAETLADTLANRPVDAWFWGHEHDCLAYHEHGGIVAARSVGHGAVPVLAREQPPPQQGKQPYDPPRLIVPDASGMPAAHPLRAVAWEYRDYRVYDDDKDQKWAKHGFAVLDLDGPDLRARYFDDEGTLYFEEEL